MTTQTQLAQRPVRFSWMTILDFTTCGILVYMLVVGLPSLQRLTRYPNLGITPLLIVTFTLAILLTGAAITILRHRLVHPVTFPTFVVNLFIQLFVLMIASNPIYWKGFVFAILGVWLIVDSCRSITLRKATYYANTVSLCLLIGMMLIWSTWQSQESHNMVAILLIIWVFAEWLHTRQDIILGRFGSTN